MGTVRNYACLHCYYCHEGLERVDALMSGPTFKVICRDCGDQHDVSREEGWPEEGVDWRPADQDAHCPKNDDHRAELWPEDQPCPECGKAMHKGELMALAD